MARSIDQQDRSGATGWPPLAWRGLYLPLLVVFLAAFLLACGGPTYRDSGRDTGDQPREGPGIVGRWSPYGPTPDGSAQLQVRGRIIEVVARNITTLELLRIRDDAGREYSFVAERFIGFTPAHLKEHQLFGLLVLVTYQVRGEQLVAVAVED